MKKVMNRVADYFYNQTSTKYNTETNKFEPAPFGDIIFQTTTKEIIRSFVSILTQSGYAIVKTQQIEDEEEY